MFGYKEMFRKPFEVLFFNKHSMETIYLDPLLTKYKTKKEGLKYLT